jgi:hypothetical protein
MWHHLFWYITVNVSEVSTASIFGVDTLEMKTAHSSQTLITIYRTTRRRIPNDSNLRSGSRENLFNVISMARFSLYRWVSVPHNWTTMSIRYEKLCRTCFANPCVFSRSIHCGMVHYLPLSPSSRDVSIHQSNPTLNWAAGRSGRHYIRIRQVLGSNLGLDTGYSHRCFTCFPPVPPEKNSGIIIRR